MYYLFKAKTTRTIKIDANNLEQAKRFFLNNHVIINKMNHVIINKMKGKKYDK